MTFASKKGRNFHFSVRICSGFVQISFKMFGGLERNSYLCSVNVKQEFGKWFLDVAKYVLTAMLLTSMIEGLSQPWLINVSAAVTLLCLVFGGILIGQGRQEEDRKERNRQRHRDKVKHGGK